MDCVYNFFFYFFFLIWGVGEMRGCVSSDPSRSPPTVSSSFHFPKCRVTLPQFAFSSRPDAKTQRFLTATSAFPCERAPLGGGVGGRSRKKMRLRCWRSKNKSAITTELWRDWLEQVVVNILTHKRLVVVEPNKQNWPDAKLKKTKMKKVFLRWIYTFHKNQKWELRLHLCKAAVQLLLCCKWLLFLLPTVIGF